MKNSNTKETIIQNTICMIEEYGEDLNRLTVREICDRSKVGLGLLNYYFESKDKLIEICVERIIHQIVHKFTEKRGEISNLSPLDKLDFLGNMTLTFLFEHYSISKISILSDMKNPKEDDNTHRTYKSYLPLVSAIRPDWSKLEVEQTTFILIAAMQQSFLRHREILVLQNIDLRNSDERKKYHSYIIRKLLGGKE